MRSNKRTQAEELNWQDNNFPVSLSDIGKFERRNEGVYVNVFSYDEDKIYPLRHTKQKHAIDLLLIDDGQKQHYCLIKFF